MHRALGVISYRNFLDKDDYQLEPLKTSLKYSSINSP